MTKLEIANELKQMSRSDRDEILALIVEYNQSPDLCITPEQERLLEKRSTKIKNGKVELIEGEKAMSELAKKYAL